MFCKFGRAGRFAMMIALVSACASSSNTAETTTPAAGGTGSGLTINILNEHASAGTLVLFIEQVGGVRQSLGTVQAGTSPRFTFAANPGSAYTLIAQAETSGSTSSSDRFTFTAPTTVTWDMNTRRLTVLRR